MLAHSAPSWWPEVEGVLERDRHAGRCVPSAAARRTIAREGKLTSPDAIAGLADDVKYKTKYKELKAKISEIEEVRLAVPSPTCPPLRVLTRAPSAHRTTRSSSCAC